MLRTFGLGSEFPPVRIPKQRTDISKVTDLCIGAAITADGAGSAGDSQSC